MLGLAVLTALIATACLGVTSAAAETTVLCTANESPCMGSHIVTHVHETSVSKSKLLTNVGTVECDVLFLADAVKGTSAPLVIEGNFTYSTCKRGTENCTTTEENGPSELEVLKVGHETASVTNESLIHVKCGLIINCNYIATGLEGTARGPVLSTQEKGDVIFKQKVEKESGTVCPKEAALDSITTTPLIATYILSSAQSSEPSVEEEFGTENPAIPDFCEVCVGDPINSATGNLTETQTDLAVRGRGPALEVVRSYNAQLAAKQSTAGPFGFGWTGPYSASLEVSGETATIHQDNGSAAVFNLKEGKYSPSSWVQATLVKEGENYVYTLSDQEKLEFNSSGQLIKVSDRHKNALTLTYKSGQLETVKDDVGRSLTFTYKESKVESVKDPMGHVVKYTYESGNLATVTLPGEESPRWKFKYDASHRLTELTDGRSHTTKNEYDASSRVTLQTDRLGQKRKLEYGETGGVQETTITEPNGSKTLEKFNASGEPLEITKASGTELAQTTKYEYNSGLQMIKRTDANGHSTTYGYDSEGNKTSEKDANENETKWVYNKTHDVTEETSPMGKTTTIARNASGDPESIKRPAPESKTQETKFKYAANGDLEEMTDPLGRATKYEYDTYGDRKAEIDAAGDKRTWGYNEDGQLTSEVSPRGNEEGAKASEFETKFERDAQGRLTKLTDPLGHETKDKYDGNGNLEAVTDPNGNATTYVYDADDQRIEVKAANGNARKTAYDSMGEIESRTDGNGNVTKYTHNSLEQLTETIDPLERKTIRKYDAAGNLKELKDAENRTITYTYDPGDRLKEVNYSDEATLDVSLTYNKDDHLIEMKDGTGTTKYTLDELNRLAEVESGNKEVIKYKYDIGNQITEITYPNGKSITRAYDSAGRLEKVTDWLGKETKFSYNRDSLPQATAFPAASENKDEYAYNAGDQLEKTTMKRGAETLASIVYARDSAGQLKSTTQTGLPGAEKVEYEYDERERLKKGVGTSFEYDPANNLTKQGVSTLKYDKGGQLEEGAGIKYTFDQVGERTKATPEKGPATTYGYDQAGNLISVKRPEEGEVKKIEDTYTYDSNGLRAAQTINGTMTHMAWDPSGSLALLLSDGVNSYIYGPEGIPFEQIASETATYLHHDYLDSTRLLTNASGEAKGKYTYAPYGAVEEHTGSASTPLGFNGQYTSEDTGLIYLRARVYDPSTAQFMSIDPLLAETRESYSYAGDNPINADDPTGQKVRSPLPPAGARPAANPNGGNFNWADSGFVQNAYGWYNWSASAWRDGGESVSTFTAFGYDVNWGWFTYSATIVRDGPQTTWSWGIVGYSPIWGYYSGGRSGFGCPLRP